MYGRQKGNSLKIRISKCFEYIFETLYFPISHQRNRRHIESETGHLRHWRLSSFASVIFVGFMFAYVKDCYTVLLSSLAVAVSCGVEEFRQQDVVIDDATRTNPTDAPINPFRLFGVSVLNTL